MLASAWERHLGDLQPGVNDGRLERRGCGPTALVAGLRAQPVGLLADKTRTTKGKVATELLPEIRVARG
ncbi:hypothetical protein [Nonomuraea roseola]|uniref:Uncharacterized protein n=1 Tax=Nonomuraea roseola TaxID=46179 RepID=A0ABV5PUR7_9ACTN